MTIQAICVRAILSGMLTLSAFAGIASAQTKRAFVVGVGAYDELQDLQKTVNDADGYSQVFRDDLEFQVTTLINPDRYEFIAAFDTFLRNVAPGDDVAFVFSGHGWSDGAENFLALSDAPESAPEAVVRADTIALKSYVLAGIRSRKPNLNLAIIDACRNNPFDTLAKSAAPKGLTRISANEGELILYSAGAAQQSLDRLADDDPSTYSVFSRILLPKLSHAERPLALIADETRSEVQSLAARVGHAQRPEMMLGVSLGFCFAGKCQVTPTATASIAHESAVHGLSLGYQEVLDQSKIMQTRELKAGPDGLWLIGRSMPIGTLPFYPVVSKYTLKGKLVAEGQLLEPKPMPADYNFLQESEVYDISVESANHVRVLTSYGYMTKNFDYATISMLDDIRASGGQLTRSPRRIGTDFEVRSIAPASGGYYAIGVNLPTDGNASPLMIARLDANLKPLWSRALKPVDAYSKVQILVDAAGFPWIFGNLPTGADKRKQAWVARLNPDGRVVWDKTLADAGGESVAAFAIDPVDGIWITGSRYQSAAGDQNPQTWVRRIKFNGDTAWTTTTEAGRSNTPAGIMYDAARKMAWVSGTASSGQVLGAQVRVFGFDADGRIVVQDLFGGLEHEYPRAMDMDGAGNLYILGDQFSATDEFAYPVPYLVQVGTR